MAEIQYSDLCREPFDLLLSGEIICLVHVWVPREGENGVMQAMKPTTIKIKDYIVIKIH